MILLDCVGLEDREAGAPVPSTWSAGGCREVATWPGAPLHDGRSPRATAGGVARQLLLEPPQGCGIEVGILPLASVFFANLK